MQSSALLLLVVLPAAASAFGWGLWNSRTPSPGLVPPPSGSPPLVDGDNRHWTPPPQLNRRTPPAEIVLGTGSPSEDNHRTPPPDHLNRRTPRPDEDRITQGFVRHSVQPSVDNRGRSPPVDEGYRLTTPHPEVELNRRTPGRTAEPLVFSEFVGVTVDGEELNLLTFNGRTPSPDFIRRTLPHDGEWSRTAEPDSFFRGRTPSPHNLIRKTPPPFIRYSPGGSGDEFFPFHGFTHGFDISSRSAAEFNRRTPPVDYVLGTGSPSDGEEGFRGRTPPPQLNRRNALSEEILSRTHVPPFHKTPPPAEHPVVFSTPGSV